MTKICMAGACGRMGRRILELAVAENDIAIGGAFDLPAQAGTALVVGVECNAPREVIVGGSAAEEIAKSDVLIDFTHAEVVLAHVKIAVAAGKACVIGTTGLSQEQQAELRAAGQQVPVIFAPNMSVGVNLLFKLTNEVAKILGLDYNVEIIEVHHNLKKDSPSGTAVRLAERAAEGLGLDYHTQTAHGREGMVGERPRAEIGMHAVRGGDVVGEHTVCFIGKGERIELVHKAHSRDNFASGALVAARFAAQAKPGFYDMQDVLGLT